MRRFLGMVLAVLIAAVAAGCAGGMKDDGMMKSDAMMKDDGMKKDRMMK